MSRAKTPSYLNTGDYIGIVSPAGKIDKEKIENAIELLKNEGFKIKIGKNALNQHNMFAGTIAERAADFQQMLDDKKIRAILCSRGGYGSIHTIQKLNFSSFLKNPKWIVGFSDITVFHAHINSRFNVKTIHATMPVKYYFKGEVSRSFIELMGVLKGKKPVYNIEPNIYNKNGVAEGVIVGGNLAVLFSLFNTKYNLEIDNKILFIEETGEYLYRIDRMMASLKLSGRLKKLKGLIVGGITGIPDDDPPFGKTIEEIIKSYVDEYDYPVCFNFPAGHIDDNMPVILGNQVTLDVSNKETVLLFK